MRGATDQRDFSKAKLAMQECGVGHGMELKEIDFKLCFLPWNKDMAGAAPVGLLGSWLSVHIPWLSRAFTFDAASITASVCIPVS